MQKKQLMVGAFLLFIDQVTKSIALRMVHLHTIIPGLSIETMFNKGIALGIAAYDEYFYYSVVTAAVIAVYIFVCIVLCQALHKKHPYICIMVYAGGIGNIIDRLLYGHVVDFIALQVGHYTFPVFNVADMYITCSIVCIIYVYIFDKNFLCAPVIEK